MRRTSGESAREKLLLPLTGSVRQDCTRRLSDMIPCTTTSKSCLGHTFYISYTFLPSASNATLAWVSFLALPLRRITDRYRSPQSDTHTRTLTDGSRTSTGTTPPSRIRQTLPISRNTTIGRTRRSILRGSCRLGPRRTSRVCERWPAFMKI